MVFIAQIAVFTRWHPFYIIKIQVFFIANDIRFLSECHLIQVKFQTDMLVKFKPHVCLIFIDT